MKQLNKIPVALLVAGYYMLKLAETIFQPLKGMPEPDFNNKYDHTML